jgi:hypothetical protein
VSSNIKIKESQEAVSWLYQETPGSFFVDNFKWTYISKETPNYYFVTARTDNLSSFCEDFFFPSLVHDALKIDNFAIRMIRCIVSIIVDLVTMPIRLITLIPRYFTNLRNTREGHPLHQYLVAMGADPRLLNRDRVYVQTEIFWNDVRRCSSTEGNDFYFIELPRERCSGGYCVTPHRP